ncbi:MAG TPA: alpha/beta hydrolase [Candidatus Binataceae bacterium]|nr:alpha/beta hydrolase [Candidatus Binataceae bacterium]
MHNEQAAIAAVAKPTSRFAEINGIRLHYLDWGGAARRTVVLAHGGSAHAHWWDHVAPGLTHLGRVLALDFRGHGLSAWVDPPDYGPAAYLKDLVGFLEFLGTPVVLVGHSMGGELAQRVAVYHPQLLAALVIVDSAHGGPPMMTRLMWRWKRRKQGGPRPELDSAEALIARFRLSPPGHTLSRQALAELALKGAEQLPNGKWAFRFDPRTRVWRRQRGDFAKPRLGAITAPTLLLRGEHSALVSARTARRMHRGIRGSVLRTIPHAHHHVPLDNPAATVAAISEFVISLDARH